jgi:uncharacterized protein
MDFPELRAFHDTELPSLPQNRVTSLPSLSEDTSMKTCSVITLLLLLGCVCAQAQSSPPARTADQQSGAAPVPETPQSKIDPAKEADIRQLMDVLGAKALMVQMMGNMETSIKPMLSNALPTSEYREKLIDLFIAKLNSKMEMQQLLDLIVPIYDKHLSAKEIKDLIQFYRTPLGQKTIEVMPKLVAESEEAGRKWGEKLGRQSMLDVLADHPEFNQAMEDAKNPAEPK